MKLKYVSHSSFPITTDRGQILLIDAFLDDKPTSPVSSENVSADYIILTHGHGEHRGDSFKIAQHCDPLFICADELANYCAEKAVELTRPKTAIPMHHNTFPVIEADPAEFATKVVAQRFTAQVMGCGEGILL